MFTTMSISWAPFAQASRVSKIFVSLVVLPSGKPITVQTITCEPASSFAASATWHGFTHTDAKLY